MSKKPETTDEFGPATPCIVCEKALSYAEIGFDKVKYHDCINNGTNFFVYGGWGSDFDGNKYEAVICDDCLDKAIQKSQVLVITQPEQNQQGR
jgi:hypothetical protein